MPKFILLTDPPKVLWALDFRDFAEKYRALSRQPENSLENFMKEFAKRAEVFNLSFDTTSPDTFVSSLIDAKFVSIDLTGPKN